MQAVVAAILRVALSPLLKPILLALFSWGFSQEHAKSFRDWLRAWWWRLHSTAKEGSKQARIAEVIQTAMEFKHSPDGTKVYTNGGPAKDSLLAALKELQNMPQELNVKYAKECLETGLKELGIPV